jgi:transcriptional regulator with XRE-family HTH domain
MDRLLRYREENARPEDKQKGRPLPQEEAASRAGVGYRQWQRWETGETMPHQSNLQQLARGLRIPIAEFYDAEEPDETRGETPDLTGTFNGTMPDELRDRLDRIEAAVAEMRKDQRKLIADLRVVLLEEFERGRAALELPRPGQAPASGAPPRRSSRAKGRRATG